MIGSSEAGARQAITEAGLEVEVVYIDRPVGDQYDDEVMDQNPRVAARLEEGDAVTINVGRAADRPPPTQHPAQPAQPTQPQPTQPPTDPAASRPSRRPTQPPTTQAPTTPAGGDDHDGAMTGAAPLWGKQTELAIGNFPIAHRPLDVRVAHALATHQAPCRGGQPAPRRPGLDAEMVAAIGDAARRIEAGELDDSFPVDVYQTGSGTSTNMNVNEVIATLASAGARPAGPPQRPRQRLAVVQRRRAGGDPPRRHRRADRHTHPASNGSSTRCATLSERTMATPSRPDAPI